VARTAPERDRLVPPQRRVAKQQQQRPEARIDGAGNRLDGLLVRQQDPPRKPGHAAPAFWPGAAPGSTLAARNVSPERSPMLQSVTMSPVTLTGKPWRIPADRVPGQLTWSTSPPFSPMQRS